jgi:hypothetical protein
MTPFRAAILLLSMAGFSSTSSNAQTFVAPCAVFSIDPSAVTLNSEPSDGSLFCDRVSVSPVLLPANHTMRSSKQTKLR